MPWMHLEVPVGACMLRFLTTTKFTMKSLFSNQRAKVKSGVCQKLLAVLELMMPGKWRTERRMDPIHNYPHIWFTSHYTQTDEQCTDRIMWCSCCLRYSWLFRSIFLSHFPFLSVFVYSSCTENVRPVHLLHFKIQNLSACLSTVP